MMGSLLEMNITALEKRDPALARLVRETETGPDIEVTVSSGGAPVPAVELGGKKYPLHSRFDPVKEAERFIGQVNTGDYDLFVVFGFGFGYHVESLADAMGSGAVCLVVEKNPAILKSAIMSRDLTGLLSDPRVIVLVDPDEDAMAEALKGRSSRTVNFITHRGSHQLYGEYYQNSLELARSYLSTKNVNIATLAKFEKIWSANIARNIPSFMASPGVNAFFDKFTGIPAIVIAAGPSLNESLDRIAGLADRCVLVAVDTSYGILRRRGIEPHFCVTVDPQLINARYFEGTADTRTVLVADPVVHPAAFRLFRGRCVTTGFSFDLMKWIEGICGERGVLTHGGSVSTSAYDFARRIGASPVALTGQDLSFTGGYAHARGSYLDSEVHLRTNRLYREEVFNRTQLSALPKIMVPGIDGGRVHTNQKMMIFLSWFEKRRDTDLVNATARGAAIPGVRHVPLDRFDDGGGKRDIWGIIDGTLAGAAQDKIGARAAAMSARLREMTADIDSLEPKLETAVGLSEKLAGLVGGKRGEGKSINALLGKLAGIDRVIESKTSIKDIISFSMQRVIHTITEGYEIDGGDSALSDEELTAKRSLYLYRGMLESTRSTRTAFGKMLALLDNRRRKGDKGSQEI